MNNKYIIFGFFAFFIPCQAMDKKEIEPIVKISDFGFSTFSAHRDSMLAFEEEELAASGQHFRTGKLHPQSTFYKKFKFNDCIQNECYDKALAMVIDPRSELSKGCPLASNLLNVYTGNSEGFSFEANHPLFPFRKVAGAALYAAEKGGNHAFLQNYKKSVDPLYEIEFSQTFSTSSSYSSGSCSED